LPSRPESSVRAAGAQSPHAAQDGYCPVSREVGEESRGGDLSQFALPNAGDPMFGDN